MFRLKIPTDSYALFPHIYQTVLTESVCMRMILKGGLQKELFMFHDAFIKLREEETRQVIEMVNPAVKGKKFSPDTAVVMTYNPPFYPGWQFIDIAEYESIPTLRQFAVINEDEVVILNWTNEPVYELNEKVPISLDIDKVCEYVRFFFTFVKGRHGRFLIAETVDDINWKEEPPPAARKAIGKMISPLEPAGNEDGGFLVKACVMFKDSLFKCDIDVKENGLVSISNEELLIEEMPVLDDVFNQ